MDPKTELSDLLNELYFGHLHVTMYRHPHEDFLDGNGQHFFKPLARETEDERWKRFLRWIERLPQKVEEMLTVKSVIALGKRDPDFIYSLKAYGKIAGELSHSIQAGDNVQSNIATHRCRPPEFVSPVKFAGH